MQKYLLAVALVFVLSIYVSIQYRRHSEYPTGQAQQPANKTITPSASEHPQENITKSEWNPPRWYRLFGWPEGIGVWVLILTIIVIAEQTSEARRAADEMAIAAKATQRSVQIIIDKERARLRMEMKPLNYTTESGPDRRLRYSDMELYQLPQKDTKELCNTNDRQYAEACEYHRGTPPDSIGPEVEYSIIQDGETSAFIDSAMFDVQVRDTWHVKYEEAMKVMELPAVIKRGSEALTRYALIFPIVSGDVLEDVKARQKFIHFYGIIRYKDVFKESREIGFYYTWKVINHPARPRFHPDRWIKRECAGYDQET